MVRYEIRRERKRGSEEAREGGREGGRVVLFIKINLNNITYCRVVALISCTNPEITYMRLQIWENVTDRAGKKELKFSNFNTKCRCYWWSGQKEK